MASFDSSNTAFDVYVTKQVFEKAQSHFVREASKRLEAMGLLAGNVYSCPEDGKNFIVVTDYLTGDNDSSAVSVRFTKNAFGELVKQFKATHSKNLLIGWMHSHPGYGCFLSSTDLATQRNYFPQSYNVALVGDPLKKEAGQMLMRAYRLARNGYEELSHAIIERK